MSDKAARNAEIIRRRLSGEWPYQIAPAMGITRRTVSRILHYYGQTNLPNAGRRPAGPPLTGDDWPTRCAESVEYDTNGGCWLWSRRTDRAGYGIFRSGGRRIRGGRDKLVHRASYEHHHGPIPEGLIVRHRCDVPTCCNPDHLLIGTHADNAADRVARNRTKRKLTDADLAAIRADRALGARALAKRHGVSPSLVYGIWAGKRNAERREPA